MATTCKLIAKSSLGSDAASIEFTSIPGTYTDLMLLVSARTSGSVTYRGLQFRFNSDTANHSYRLLYGEGGAGVGSSSESNVGYVYGYTSGNSATASTFGNAMLYVPNYANTTTNKSCSLESVSESNTANMGMGATAGLWSSTAAITTIRIYPASTDNLKSGSSAYLYGITKA